MELPPWLKIENIIGNLRLSGWFKGWFKFGNRIETNTTNNYNIQIILPVDANKNIFAGDQKKLIERRF
jgi:hypothetical protein